MQTTPEPLAPRLFAEALGTFALVFAGTGAIVVNEAHGGSVTHLGIAITFGLVVMAMIYALGDISGAHINPAVTVAFYFAKRFPGRDVLPYVLVQCGGAIAASALIATTFPSSTTLGATLPAGAWWQSFVIEVVLTFLLMLVILRVSSGSRETGLMAGAAIGAVVACEALFAGPITGASMNPARSLGPALVGGHLGALPIYLAAPTLGAQLAIPTCRLMGAGNCCPGAAGGSCS